MSTKNGFRKRILVHALIGSLAGYLILHPASFFITDISENPSHLHWDAFIQALSLQHISMAAYFMILGAVFGMIIAIYTQKLFKIHEKLHLTSITDELTGLLNRRGFFNFAQQSLKLANRTNKKMVLLFADMDKLKWINDVLGHHEGDSALVDTVNILKNTFRESDIIARMGGDEFAVLFMETPESDFKIIYNRLQKNIEAFNAQKIRRYKLSISTGSVKYNPESPCSIDELLKRADTSMYENKHYSKILSSN